MKKADFLNEKLYIKKCEYDESSIKKWKKKNHQNRQNVPFQHTQ